MKNQQAITACQDCPYYDTGPAYDRDLCMATSPDGVELPASEFYPGGTGPARVRWSACPMAGSMVSWPETTP